MVFSTTDPNENVEIRMGTEGPAARPATTVNAILAKTVADNAAKVAVRVKREGVWVEWTWTEYLAEATRVAKALVALGVKEREAVAIIGRARRATTTLTVETSSARALLGSTRRSGSSRGSAP